MRSKGFDYEEQAKRYLIDKGLYPVQSNFQCKLGEIDLIMSDNETLVFIEVRYRKSSHYGSAAESISYSKRQKLLRTANYYLQKHKRYDVPCRFDTVTFQKTNSDIDINWTISAFGEEY